MFAARPARPLRRTKPRWLRKVGRIVRGALVLGAAMGPAAPPPPDPPVQEEDEDGDGQVHEDAAR